MKNVLAVALVLFLVGCGEDESGEPAAQSGPSGTMIMATTTSTRDSGLLDTLVPRFEREGDCKVKTLAVGSGQALTLGERGDADVLLVHSPDAEEEYMSGGHGLTREPVMHNDFVLVGPEDDPAKIADAPDATEAMKRIAAEKAPFASRADESGTNARELKLWEEAGIEPRGSWYLETGQGMGETLTIASQKQAYTLADRGTFLATQDNIDSKLLNEGSPDLRNDYHVIVVKADGTNVGCAKEFSTWITSAPVQETIGGFGVEEFGEPLFTPDAKD
jgi:tungstate transport system substrate-binding protein